MAAARAAARRQAILSSRGNRLAKLTSSARGDDPGGVYAKDDPPLPTIGSTPEKPAGEGDSSNPSSSSPPKPQPHSTPSSAQLPEWSSEQQEEFRRLLMGASGQPSVANPLLFNSDPKAEFSTPSVPEDALSSLFSTLGAGGGAAFDAETPPPAPSRTITQKLVPVVHTLSMVAILVWFIGWKEPELHAVDKRSSLDNGHDERWMRWARLSHSVEGNVSPMPTFFWTFITLQLALHSLRIFSQSDSYRPPTLLALVLPHLPPPLSRTILTSLKYFQMVSMVLDDLALLVFGVGLVVFLSSIG